MLRHLVKLILPLILLSTGCGQPPSGGGGPPQGDFPVSVVGARVVSEPFTETVVLTGTFDSPDSVQVMSEIAGRILELPVAEGSQVEEGEVLVRLRDEKIHARLQEADARLRLARATKDRAVKLRETNSVSEQELDEARAAVDRIDAEMELLREELSETVIYASFTGTLGEHTVSRGQVIQPGNALMELVKTDPLEIQFEVPENQLQGLHHGAEVSITTAAFGNETFSGRVGFLSPRLRRSTRTLPVKALVPNSDGRLKPGMFARVELKRGDDTEQLFVPETALMPHGSDHVVMVRNSEGRAEHRTVKAGGRRDGRVQILEGLEEGEIVVAEGLIKVRPDSLLQFTEASRDFGVDPGDYPLPEDERDELEEEV